MITRREAAQRLNIPVEMAARNGLPSQLTEAHLREIDENPPPWLAQSRANRTGKRQVWVDLKCVVCGFTEKARPKKWWPDYSDVFCDHHDISELPHPLSDDTHLQVGGIGSRFVGLVDESTD